MSKNKKIVSYSLCSWLLLLVFCMQFVVSFFAKKLWSLLSTQSLTQYDYIWLTQIFAILLPSLLLCLYNGSGIKRTFGVKSLKLYKLCNCVGLGICLQPVAIAFNIPMQNFLGAGGVPVAPPNGISDILRMVIFLCIMPAVCEELLLRGMLLTSVKRKGYVFSIIITTFMFVLLHNDLGTASGHIVLGVATAFAVLNTGSVLAGMAVHFSFNFCGIMIDYITNKFYIHGGFVGTLEFFLVLALAGLAISCVFFKGVYSKKLKKYKSDQLMSKLCGALLNIPVIVILAVYVLRSII